MTSAWTVVSAQVTAAAMLPEMVPSFSPTLAIASLAPG